MSAAAAGTAAAAAAAVAAVAFLPAFKNTRAGITEGLNAELELGGEVAEAWILKTSGAVMGGMSGWVVSSAMMERAASRGNSIAAYARVPAAAMGALFSASLAAELAQPAVLGGKRLGSAVSLGAEGLSQDLLGGSGSSMSEQPRPLLEETKRRLEAISQPPAGKQQQQQQKVEDRAGGSSEGSREESEEEEKQKERDEEEEERRRGEALAMAQVAARVVAEDAAKLALVAQLRGLRAREEALRAELLHVPRDGRASRRADLQEQIQQVVELKAEAKRRCLAEHGQKLTRLMAADVRSKAAALEEFRARQLSLRMTAKAAEGSGDKAEARRLRRAAKGLDAAKKALKLEAAEVLGVKLSRHAKSVPKYHYSAGDSAS